jgi:hypothetical protein
MVTCSTITRCPCRDVEFHVSGWPRCTVRDDSRAPPSHIFQKKKKKSVKWVGSRGSYPFPVSLSLSLSLRHSTTGQLPDHRAFRPSLRWHDLSLALSAKFSLSLSLFDPYLSVSKSLFLSSSGRQVLNDRCSVPSLSLSTYIYIYFPLCLSL